jgi:hypothetical protein
MKSFQPKPDGVPPDRESCPGDPPSARTEDAPEQTKPETDPAPLEWTPELGREGLERSVR